HLFGPFRLSRDGDPLDEVAGLGRASARTLLKWFLLHPGVRIGSRELCELLWPGRGGNVNRLHVTLHHLRHLLEPNLAARHPSTFLRSDGKGLYWFDFADRWWTDVIEVDRLYAAGKAAEADGDSENAIDAYEALLAYHHRTFLPENLFDAAFDSARAAHEVLHRDAQ
ncbi:AfsR/SARP family transcriptional regulator, partial [Nocardia gipuzkoensis]